MHAFRSTVVAVSRALVCAALTQPAAAQSRVGFEPVTFELTQTTQIGQSVFVLGDHDSLGGGDITQAVRLVPDRYPTWSVTVSLPAGTEQPYAFYLRDDAISALQDAANGVAISPQQAVTVPGEHVGPVSKKVILQASGLESPVLSWRQGDGPYAEVSMEPIDPLPNADGSKTPRFVAWGLGRAGPEPISYFVTGSNGVRLPAVGSIGTALDASFVGAREATPYAPVRPTNPRIEFRVIPTDLIPDTASSGGVTGRGVRILLPRNYSDNTEARYPVLYMHDGQNVFDPGGPFGSWSVNRAVLTEVGAGRAAEIIVVAIDNSPSRSAEYVPELGNATADFDRYLQFITEELKPYIDANYRTPPGREHTGIAGSSFGGIATLNDAMDRPDIFGKAGAFSTSFWVGGTMQRVINGANGELDGVRLYLDAGTVNDGLTNTLAVRDALVAGTNPRFSLEGDMRFAIGFGQAHNEAAWDARFERCLSFLFPADEAAAAAASLAPDGSWDRDNDGRITIEDDYAQHADPQDLNADGVIDAADDAAVRDWLRRLEFERSRPAGPMAE